MKDKARLVAKNAVIILIGRVLEFLFAIISVVLIARYLGVEQFGEYAFVRGVGIVITPLISFGSFMVLLREISVNKEKAPALLSSALILEIVICSFVLLITTVVFFIVKKIHLDINVCIYMVIISQTLLVMQKTVSSVFIANEKVIYDSSLIIFTRLLSLLLIIVAIVLDLKMIGLFSAIIIVYFMGFSVACVLLARNFFIPKAFFDVKLIIFLMKEAWTLSVSNLIVQGYMYINVFMLKALTGPMQISFFQIPQRITEPLKMLPRSLMLAIMPTFSLLGHIKEKKEEFHSLYHRMLRYIIICTLPICVCVTIYAAPIISLLFGKDFLGAVIPLQISIWTIIIFIINILYEHVLTALMKQKVLVFSNGFCLLVNCLLGIYLIPIYGAVGASVAMACGSFAMFVLNYYFTARYLGWINIYSITVGPAISSLIMWILIINLSNKINMFLIILSTFIMYFSMLILFKTFTTQEIDMFKTLTQKIVCRFDFLKKTT